MRVLHVAESLPGGIATYLNETLRLQTQTWGEANVYLLAPESHLRFLAKDIRCKLIPYRRNGRNLTSLFRLLLALHAANAAMRPEIVHAHSTLAGAIVRIWGMLKRQRPAIVYCAHGWAFLRESKGWVNRLVAIVERWLAYACDGICSISNYERAAALRAGLPSGHCRVIRYGISPRKETTQPIDLVLDPAKLNLFFIGRHDRQKGLDILLDAFRHLPTDRFSLYVAGARILDKDKTSHQPLPNVHYLGWINAEHVDAYYCRFDALLVPSRWEGFGLVVLEAMRNRLAVIASDRGALPEIVQDGVAGRIFHLNDPQSLTDILLHTDRAELAKFGDNGYRRYLEHFTVERMHRETLALYAAALEQHQKVM
ncbi:MAG TPA: glycosyltransferase [Nevskiales bacterium]|nr:glycosyltransferase [Nevskiales bacterium]